MATGRTVGSKYIRAYVDGYDLSGHTRTVGQLGFSFEQNEIVTLTDAVKGAWPGQCIISVGDINAVLETNSSGTFMHNKFKAGGDAVRDVMVPIGIRAAPANGDEVFCAQVTQNAYMMNDPGEGVVTVTMDLGNQDERADSTGAYWLPWGNLIHAKATRTAVNASTGEYIGPGQTLFGGYMMYQVFPGSTGKVTFKIQDCTGAGGAWSDLVSSGILTQTKTTGQAAVIAMGSTGTVDKHLRWQIAFGGAPAATTCTFALAFVRGRESST